MFGHPTGDRAGEVSRDREKTDNKTASLLAQEDADFIGQLAPPHIPIEMEYRNEQGPAQDDQDDFRLHQFTE